MRDGRFWVRRITISKRLRAKLREVNDQLERRRYQPIPEQGRWLGSVVRGHRAYYAVPGNRTAVAAFRTQVTRHWHRALGAAVSARGSAGTGWTALPLDGCRPPVWCIPSPMCVFASGPKAGAQCVSSARWDLCGGPLARAVPTAIRRVPTLPFAL